MGECPLVIALALRIFNKLLRSQYQQKEVTNVHTLRDICT